MSDDFRTLLPVDHREPVAGPTTRQTPRRWRRCTQLHHVSIQSKGEAQTPRAKLPQKKSSSAAVPRSRVSASVALMPPRVPVTANETATAADMCYSYLRYVSLQSHMSSIIAILKKTNCRRERDCVRFGELLRGAARNCFERPKDDDLSCFPAELEHAELALREGGSSE